MALPPSFQTKLKSTRKRLERATFAYTSDRDLTSFTSEVSGCLFEIHLLLDRSIDAIWSAPVFRNSTEKKPNLYFPLTLSIQKFDERMKQYQLSQMKIIFPEIYAKLVSVQPFSNERQMWWNDLYKLSKDRHSHDIRTEHGAMRSLTFGGSGQAMYIKSLVIENDNRSFQGEAWNGMTGETEPLIIKDIMDLRAIIADGKIDVVDFVTLCLTEVEKLLKLVFMQLQLKAKTAPQTPTLNAIH